MTQSTIMMEYLDDAFPLPELMPRSPYARAQRRLWARQIDDEMHAHAATISFSIAFAQLLRKRMDTPEKLQTYLQAITDPKTKARAIVLFDSDLHSLELKTALGAYCLFLRNMERTLAITPWLVGDQFSLAEIDIIP